MAGLAEREVEQLGAAIRDLDRRFKLQVGGAVCVKVLSGCFFGGDCGSRGWQGMKVWGKQQRQNYAAQALPWLAARGKLSAAY